MSGVIERFINLSLGKGIVEFAGRDARYCAIGMSC